MTTRYTQSEWRTIIDDAERNLPSSFPLYKSPSLGTPDFAKCIDHTLLKLEATREQIDELCEEARRHEFLSVCVRLKWVERAVHNLQGSSVVVACVVGFHEGTYSVSEKVKEASMAVAAGALELDMVINYPLLKQQRFSQVFTDVAAVRNVAPHPVVLKVILETSKLTQVDIVAGCKIAQAANADFVKTSTGFGGQGATEENVRLMKSVIGPNMKVKASGGVKTVNECVAMLEAGAERIGASNGVWIMKEAQSLLEDFTHAAGDKGRKNTLLQASKTIYAEAGLVYYHEYPFATSSYSGNSSHRYDDGRIPLGSLTFGWGLQSNSEGQLDFPSGTEKLLSGDVSKIFTKYHKDLPKWLFGAPYLRNRLTFRSVKRPLIPGYEFARNLRQIGRQNALEIRSLRINVPTNGWEWACYELLLYPKIITQHMCNVRDIVL
ncbi:MAG: hypothetical protein Q9185_001518, partial [Variospora sp. 1 TL-2023]